MAAIDKIYGTQAQYDEFHTWAKEHRPQILEYFYPRDYERPITNLPQNEDMWLLENCPLEWVVHRIKEQYDLD